MYNNDMIRFLSSDTRSHPGPQLTSHAQPRNTNKYFNPVGQTERERKYWSKITDLIIPEF